jgi:hypothetical protein
MNRKYLIPVIAAAALGMTGCDFAKSAAEIQAEEGAKRANGIQFSGNAELDNIEARIEITANPNTVGFITLLNQMGQPVLYTSVRGKVTSSGKRLTDPVDINGQPAPSDEGTWGSSDSYIYFWTMDGQYMQWAGPYLYSNAPVRLSTEPLVLDIGAPDNEVTPWGIRAERGNKASPGPAQ